KMAVRMQPGLGGPMDFVAGLVAVLVLIWVIGRWRRRPNAGWRASRGDSLSGAQSLSRQTNPRSNGRVAGTADHARDFANSTRGPTAQTIDARWIQPGERIKIGDVSIDGGLFYFGRSLPTLYGGNENALVDG